MSKSIEEQLRERIAAHLKIGSMEPLGEQVALSRIMADVGVALVLARREGYRLVSCCTLTSTEAYPLPKRIRRVLREEPVPDGGVVLFRVIAGQLQVAPDDGSRWEPYRVMPSVALMRHALDLYDNPYRMEEVPADESNPWPEIEP